MKVVKAKKTHLLLIENLEKERFPEDFYSLKSLLGDFENSNIDIWVLENEANLVGYIILFHIFEEANIMRIAIKQENEGQGLASKLLVRSLSKLKDIGVTKVYLEVSEKNNRAINFYKKHGFEPSNKREKYYNDLSDAIIMWKFF